MSFKRAKVVMLPSEVSSDVKIILPNEEIRPNDWFINDLGTLLKCIGRSMEYIDFDGGFNTRPSLCKKVEFYNLYFTSCENIKKGFSGKAIVTVKDDTRIKYLVDVIVTEQNQCYCKGDRKFPFEYYAVNPIISTTDSSLLGEKISFKWMSIGLEEFKYPKPSRQFINKFIKEYLNGNTITEVLVEYESKNISDNEGFFNLNDVVKVNGRNNTITIKKINDSFTRKQHIENIKAFAKVFVANTETAYKQAEIDKWIDENI